MSIRTSLGDLIVEPTPMGELREGDRFVGPDDVTVYAVMEPCGAHSRGWLLVRRLNNFRGREDTGTDNPNEAWFTYPLSTLLNRVV
jgi:hypothetical protein